MYDLLSFALLGYHVVTLVSGYAVNQFTNNENRPGAHLIVIAAPRQYDTYYQRNYFNILQFDIDYAMKVMGKDNIVVLGDQYAIQILKRYLPDDILLESEMEDIWMRDPTTVNPYNPVQFRLTPASYEENQRAADRVQRAFSSFFKNLGVQFDETPKYDGYLMDGGNVVDNYNDKIVVTDRFLQDNQLTKAEAKQMLKELYRGVDKVAIVPTDDPEGLAHSDGMVMFINSNAAMITNYNYNKTLKKLITKELLDEFPGIELIQDADTWTSKAYDPKISSACGLMVNGVLTENFLYVPTFNNPTDISILTTIRGKTNRTVVPINASRVCEMGGSVRCLSWQQTGENARKIIEAARNDDYFWLY
ncbi:uncharacterized protein LOC106474008 [Limulus polyphemus]|uniref:Uncharacterized protein LOC106474008 n=1 Tax=Limulus polyphemus TaxID=6850 RepID=A0ABM1BWQ9_LIMPO|nr:uncharacterized protein LOC106474008 [Limulus polyphemus]